MASVDIALAMYVFVLKYGSLLAACSSASSFKKMPLVGSELYIDPISVHDVKSALGCFSHCFRHSCKSYGIDSSKMKCYLYDFHVWYGGNTEAGANITYYWKFWKTCPESYTFVASLNFCYKFYMEHVRFHQGMDRCIQDGGLLAIVDTVAKFNIVKQLRNNIILVGGTDNITYDEWKWFNGADIVPFRSKGVRHCIAVNPNTDSFVNPYCVKEIPFVCEIPIGLK